MRRSTKIWQFNTAHFRIILDWDYDDYADMSWDETGETQDKIASGEWAAYNFQVRVMCGGREIGNSYLGGSIYADPADFRDHIGLAIKSRADGCNYGSYFSDMVKEAIGEARKTLCSAPRLRCKAPGYTEFGA